MLRLSIQDKLIELCKAGPFFAVKYGEDGKPLPVDTSTAPHIEPSSVRCNETGSTFGVDKANGMAYTLTRTEWRFEVRLGFGQEVTLEEFETRLQLEVPIIPRDPVKNLPQVMLILTKSDAVHPVQQQPATGTSATIAFRAEVGRV